MTLRPPAAVRDVLWAIVLGVLYLALAKLSRQFVSVGPVVAVWPPVGLALGVLIIRGLRLWPAFFVADVINTYTQGIALGPSLAISLGATSTPLLGAWLLRRGEFHSALDRVMDVIKFVVIAGIVANAVGATLGVAALGVGGVVPIEQLLGAWRVWFLSDMVAILVLGGAIIVWAGTPLEAPSLPRFTEAFLLGVVTLLVAVMVFILEPDRAATVFFVFPVGIWAALRFGQRGAVSVILVVSAVATWAEARLIVRAPMADVALAFLPLQVVLALVAGTSLIMAGAIAERRTVESMYGRLLETAREGIWLLDPQGRATFVNRQAGAMLGYSVEEITGRSVLDFVDPSFRNAVEATLEQRRYGESRNYDLLLRRRDGTPVWAHASTAPIFGRGNVYEGSVDMMTDITARKNAELELRRAVSLQEAIVESTADGILVVDRAGKIMSYNQRFVDLWRIPTEILAARDDEKAIAFVLHQLKEPEAFVRKVRELYSTPEAESFDVLEFKDGRVFERFSRPQRIGDEIVGRVWSFRDVTESRHTEEELRQHRDHLEDLVAKRTRELAVLNRELESFSYSVSHDLRAPLRGIDGFSQILLEDYGDKLDEAGKTHLQRVRSATQRMSRLIDDLLELSRITRREIERATVDVSGMVHELADELRASAPDRRADLVIADGVVAHADADLLRIVLANLLSNAWKFTSKHPTARIEFGVRGDGVGRVYYVRDDGAGFDMKHASRLFGPFQRLHGPTEFEGTGIGLATVQRVVQRHGGRVWAEGAVEKGSTFYFTLGEGTT